jgi:hypothetical protein
MSTGAYCIIKIIYKENEGPSLECEEAIYLAKADEA